MERPNLPPWREPITGRDGTMTQTWRSWFEQNEAYQASLEQRIADLEVEESAP